MRRSLLLLSWIAVAATVVAQTANPNCNGLRNPTDLNLYPAYSGAKGVKLEIAANAVTGVWGMNFTNHLSYNQLTTYSQSGYTSYCWFLAGGTNSLWNFGDGTTNTFHAYTKNTLVDYEIYIYDRHGNMVFHSVDPLEGWDGTYKGKNCAQGAYVSLPPTNATTAAYAQ